MGKKRRKQSNKKAVKFILVLVVIVAVILIVKYFEKPNKSPKDALVRYMSYIEEKNYEKMYEMLSKETKKRIEKETYLSRNKNIYEGIEAKDIKLNVVKENKESQNAEVIYQITMQTIAGEINYSNTSKFKYEDEEYKLEWSSSDIFPDLKDEYKVRVNILEAERGKIIDRKGTILAGKQTASSSGFVPRENE